LASHRGFDDSAETGIAATGARSAQSRRAASSCRSAFCTAVHSFPQRNFQISLANKKHQVYRLAQIEPGSVKNLAAQLKEGAIA
jgi:hypothetical protein